MVVHIVQRLHSFDESRWLASPKRWPSNGPWWTKYLGVANQFRMKHLIPIYQATLQVFVAWWIPLQPQGVGNPRPFSRGGLGRTMKATNMFYFRLYLGKWPDGLKPPTKLTWQLKIHQFFIGETFSFMVDFGLIFHCHVRRQGYEFHPLKFYQLEVWEEACEAPWFQGDFDFGKPPWFVRFQVGSTWGAKHGVDFLQCSSRFWKNKTSFWTLWIRVAFDHPRQKTRTWQGW